MAHLLLLVLLALWAILTLRGRPVRLYAPIYFVGGLLGFIAEFTFSGLLNLYHLRLHLLPDPFHDVRLAAVADKLGTIPLLALYFAVSSRRRPAAVILGGGLAMTVVESFFFLTGAIEYRAWNPVLTGIFFMGFIYIMHKLGSEEWSVPLWLHIDAFAFWAAFLVDLLFHGAFWLWHYDVLLPFIPDPRGASRLVAFLFNGLLIAPLATAISLVDGWRRPLPIAAAIGLLLLLEVAGLTAGVIQYDGWNLALALVRCTLAILLPVGYTRLYTQGTHQPVRR